VTCGGAPEKGKRKCKLCAISAATMLKERRGRLITEGKCWRCAQSAVQGMTQCRRCLNRAATVTRNYDKRQRRYNPRKGQLLAIYDKDPWYTIARLARILYGRPHQEERGVGA